jgi:hypothetical protein
MSQRPKGEGDAKLVREPAARARAERLRLTDQQRWNCRWAAIVVVVLILLVLSRSI